MPQKPTPHHRTYNQVHACGSRAGRQCLVVLKADVGERDDQVGARSSCICHTGRQRVGIRQELDACPRVGGFRRLHAGEPHHADRGVAVLQRQQCKALHQARKRRLARCVQVAGQHREGAIDGADEAL